MTCKDIIKQWLKEHGYDGLWLEEAECGCSLDDLMPCSGGMGSYDCEPAYFVSDDNPDGCGKLMSRERRIGGE